ncbi:MAG: AAA ATPase [Alyxoria varia]|nr:MAG: AAA ATPase [Alyxoria varia]
MASTIVLGKRLRSHGSADVDINLTATPSKRRSKAPKSSNEKFTIHEDEQNNDLAGSPMQVDGGVVPQTEKRVALSPSKINSHFRVTKAGATPLPTQAKVEEKPQSENTPTPSTPRHRDALSKKASPPITPRHRIAATGFAFQTGSNGNTPRTPKAVSNTPARAIRCVYNDARKAFSQGSNGCKLVGRENERKELRHFLEQHMSDKTGGSLYVSGPPGTGKSAHVGEVCRAVVKDNNDVKFSYLNCMSIKKPGDVFIQLMSELGISDDVFGAKASALLQAEVLRSGAKEEGSPYLVILDEIDQLLSIDLESLYTLFSWSLAKQSRLILVGIANALDLTDRSLPRLKSRSLKPQLLPFLPYVAPEIASVLISRSRSLLPANTTAPADFTPFIVAPAIQLISKKVAAQTGDLRKAFNLAQKSIDLVEAETRKNSAAANQQAQPAAGGDAMASPDRTPLSDNTNMSTPTSTHSNNDSLSKTIIKSSPNNNSSSPLEHLTPENAPRASLAHVLQVSAAAFNNGTASRLKSLNLQQKAALCSLVALERKHKRETQLQHHQSENDNNFPSPSATLASRKKDLIKIRASQAGTPSSVRRSGGARGGDVTAAPTIRALFEAYSALCTRENVLQALSQSEFKDVLANLETSSLVVGVDARGGRGGGAGSFVGTMTATPSKRRKGGAGSFAAAAVKVEDRRVASCGDGAELEEAVEGVGCGILRRMLTGWDLY